MACTITVLCDNGISRPGLVGEHGFSALIERDGKTFLFDTGPGMSLPLNFETLGKDPGKIEKIIISHGHYDHTGGLKWILSRTGEVEVVAHPGIFARHMVKDSQEPSAPARFIGCPWSREELEAWGAGFAFTDKTKKIDDDITFLTGYALDPKKVALDSRLVVPYGAGLTIDSMEDDASLLIETAGHPVLLLGCAHAGVLNILGYIRNELGVKRLKAVLGGTHLMFYGQESLAEVMDQFDDFNVEIVGVSHCTGMKATLELAGRFGSRFFVASVGSVLDFT
ncbi:MAG: MBL fold metallo-hydrolase [Desulfobacteraceae bacterium]|nr:MAG: MBL fold metallo-hydrolase [Desulfobacteraceae bacterium]